MVPGVGEGGGVEVRKMQLDVPWLGWAPEAMARGSCWPGHGSQEWFPSLGCPPCAKGTSLGRDTEPREGARPLPQCPTSLTFPCQVPQDASTPIQQLQRVACPAASCCCPAPVTASPSLGVGGSGKVKSDSQHCWEDPGGDKEAAASLSPSQGGQHPTSPLLPLPFAACAHRSLPCP